MAALTPVRAALGAEQIGIVREAAVRVTPKTKLGIAGPQRRLPGVCSPQVAMGPLATAA